MRTIDDLYRDKVRFLYLARHSRKGNGINNATDFQFIHHNKEKHLRRRKLVAIHALGVLMRKVSVMFPEG